MLVRVRTSRAIEGSNINDPLQTTIQADVHIET